MFFVFNPDTVTCGARLREEVAKRAEAVGSEATSGARFAGGRGGKREEHVTESGGSRVTWNFE